MSLDLVKKEFHFEGRAPFDLFKQDITILIDREEADFDYAEKCVKALNEISEEVIDILCEASVRYCIDFCENVGEAPPEFYSIRDVLSHIKPNSMSIDPPQDKGIVIHLELECDWEEEHGLEWLIKDNKVYYVGPFCNASPYSQEEGSYL